MGPLRTLLLGPASAALLAGAASAEPMDLLDPRPRQVAVSFEVSPSDRPAQRDAVYTPPLPARLEPSEREGEIRVSVAGEVVEAHLLAGEDPRPGSFADFVWLFDAATGHVLSAELSGVLIKTLDFGAFTSPVEAEIRVRMATGGVAGFAGPRRLFGQVLYTFCDRTEARGCTLVETVRYDPERGYVNAVGVLAVSFRGVIFHTFSPLGEAVFSEVPGAGALPEPPGSSFARHP